MQKLSKISIVIPSYNKVEYVEETLQSIVDQKYPNLEVIIQDGGSTDGTLDIIKKYARKYPRIFSWESKKDKGQTDAINKGFGKATGEIFAFINADDVYEKGALLIVGKYFSDHPDTEWLAGRGKVIDEKGKEIAKWVTGFKNFFLFVNNYNFLLMVNYIMQPSVFISKKVYFKRKQFIGLNNYVMEYEYWLKLGSEKMPKIFELNLSSFRLDKKGASLTLSKKILKKDFDILKKYCNNPIILGIHWLFNLGRAILIK